MYQIRFNGDIIYDPRGANETDRLIVSSARAALAVGAAGSLTFKLPDDHPLIHRLTRMHGVLELLDDGVPIFRGRIVQDDDSEFEQVREITAEGALTYLNDSIVEPYDFPGDYMDDPDYQEAEASGNVVEFWLSKLFESHNAQTGSEQHLILGDVTVQDPNNYISRSCDKYSTTWEVISEKLAGSALGGYLMIRYENDGNYLDYLSELPLTNVQTVEFAKNLTAMTTAVYGENLYTAIYPVGADGLTITDLQNEELAGGLIKDGKIIYDPQAETEYEGRITKVVTWDDVTLATNLRSKAAIELAQQGTKMPTSITCKACDLHGVDSDTPSYRVGRNTRVISAGNSQIYPLLELNINILDPASTIITLGATQSTLTSQMSQLRAGKDGAPGADGVDAVLLCIASTNGTVFKNDNVSTVLRVTIYRSGEQITDLSALRAAMGDTAELRWSFQRLGEETYYAVDPDDPRIGGDGFTFTLTPDDVDAKATFVCELIV